MSISELVSIIQCRKSSFANGHAFGHVGSYEVVEGTASFRVDPRHRANSTITDIQNTRQGADELVSFKGDFFILRPTELNRGNRRLLVDLPNRGNKRVLQFFNDAPATNSPTTLLDAGTGYLMRQGYSIASIAWQGDVLPGEGRLTMALPEVEIEGSSPSERITAEFIVDRHGVLSMPLSSRIATRSLPCDTSKTDLAVLTRQRYPDSVAETVDRRYWQFARAEGGGTTSRVEGDGSSTELAVVPCDSHLYVEGGFTPGWIYRLSYFATRPLVLGLGFAAVRDLTAYFTTVRNDANPLWQSDSPFEKNYAWGRSQAGRALREFVYLGFNSKLDGKRLFDGVMSHIAGAGKTNMERFSNLVIPASRQYENHDHPSDRFPFSYALSTDHNTGCSDAICKRPETDPLIIHSQTSTEYWQRRGSLVHTDSHGHDLAQPSNVRIYTWSSTQHWADPNLVAPSRGVCENLLNSADTSFLFRSQLMILDEWASQGLTPPPSQVPSACDGTLVTYETWKRAFPSLPGILTPNQPNQLFSGHTDAENYAVLVPHVDADGNELAGVKAPMIAVPLGTFTGWNIRTFGFGRGDMHDFTGSYIPFSETDDVARHSGDPRPSIGARYSSQAQYQDRLNHMAQRLVQQRFMLAEDLDRVNSLAANWSRPRHSVNI
jgi:hypothetical protein